MTVFDKEWFERHQSKLLWVLNHWSTRRLAKWMLRIRKYDVGYDKRIVEILPNCYKIDNGDGSFTLDVRTYNKYARRLYYSLHPLWWAMHLWDKLFDRWAPQLSFGFDTLTVFPDPDPGVTTCSGYVSQNYNFASGVAWGTIVAAAGSNENHTNPTMQVDINGDVNTNTWSSISRMLFLFDASALPGAATAATLSLFGTGALDFLGVTPDIDIYTSNPASNVTLAATDYATLGSTSQTGSPIAFASWSTSAYNNFTLNATGLSNITAGICKFGARNANYDVAAVQPTWSNSESTLTCNSANQTGTANDPKLVITYTPKFWLLGAH